jgi:alkylation response protein AidB-like acyl-CoA dehydrogenase
MDFAFSEEQQALRAAARDYLADRYPTERVVELVESEAGWDPKSWTEFTEMGWLDAELGVLEHAVLAEETGRALYPGPLWTTLALARPAGYDGDGPATLAVAEPDGPLTIADAASCKARADGNQVSGNKVFVPDLAIASAVAAVAGDGIYVVPTDGSGVTVTPRSTMDHSRRYAELTLDNASARRVSGPEVFATVRRRALAFLACEAVGVAQRALETATEHAKNRQAFDRPIGTFQAVSHQIADVFTQVELARSLAYWAAWAVDAEDERADLACAAAKSAAAEAAVFACERAIQVLGGIGFTWEHYLHRYYKRAQWIDSYEGYAAKHRADIASALLTA